MHKIIRGQSSSTGNFYQHYFRTHTDEYPKLKDYCDERIEKKMQKKEISSKKQAILSFATCELDPHKVIKKKKINKKNVQWSEMCCNFGNFRFAI